MTAGSFEVALDDEEIREAIARPRNIPRKKREDIASILYREIVLGEDYDVRDIERFIEDYGVFYLILVSLKGSDDWARLKELASASRISALIMLRIVLEHIFDVLDDFPRFEPDLKKLAWGGMAFYFQQFKAILESTLELWHRRLSNEAPPAPARAAAQEKPGSSLV